MAKDMLFLGITRPATKWGVPAEGFIINFLGCFLLYLWVAQANAVSIRGVVCLALGPAIHFVMRAAMSIDHNMFRIFRLFLVTRHIQLTGVSVLWAMHGRKRTPAAEVGSSV